MQEPWNSISTERCLTLPKDSKLGPRSYSLFPYMFQHYFHQLIPFLLSYETLSLCTSYFWSSLIQLSSFQVLIFCIIIKIKFENAQLFTSHISGTSINALINTLIASYCKFLINCMFLSKCGLLNSTPTPPTYYVRNIAPITVAWLVQIHLYNFINVYEQNYRQTGTNHNIQTLHVPAQVSWPPGWFWLFELPWIIQELKWL